MWPPTKVRRHDSEHTDSMVRLRKSVVSSCPKTSGGRLWLLKTERESSEAPSEDDVIRMEELFKVFFVIIAIFD